MENYGTALEYAGIAANSSGTALEKFEAYEESIEAKTNALTAAFEGLSNNLVNSDIIKFALDLTTSMVTALDKTHLLQVALTGLLIKGGAAGIEAIIGKFTAFENSLQQTATASALVGDAIRNGTLSIKAMSVDLSTLNEKQLKYVLSLNASKLGLDRYNKEQLEEELLAKGVNAETAKSIALELTKQGGLKALTSDQRKLNAELIKNIALEKLKTLTNPYTLALAAITAIVVGVIAWNKHQKELIKNAKEIAKAYQEAQNELQKIQEEVLGKKGTEGEVLKKGLVDEYKQLAQGVDITSNRNISLTADEYERFLDISNNLAEKFPELVSGWDNQGNAILDYNKVLKDTIQLMEDKIKLDKKAYIEGTGAYEDQGGYKEQIKGYRADLSNKYSELLRTVNSLGYKQEFELGNVLDKLGLTMTAKDILPNKKEILAALKEQGLDTIEFEGYIDKIQATQDAIDALGQQISQAVIVKLSVDPESGYEDIEIGYLDEFEKGVQKIASTGNLTTKQIEAQSTALAQAFAKIQKEIPTENIEKYQTQLKEGSITQEYYNTKVEELSQKLLPLADGNQALLTILTAITQGWIDTGDSIASATEAAENEVQTLNEVAKSVKEVATAIDTVKSAREEYNQYGFLSIETLLKLIDLDNEYLATLIDESGQLDFNTDLTSALMQAKLLEAQASAEQALAEAAVTDASNAAAGSALATSEAFAILGNEAATSAEKVEALMSALQGKGLSKEDLSQATQGALAAYQLVQDTMDKFQSGKYVYKRSSTGSKSKSSKTTKDPVLEKYKAEVKEVEHLHNMDKLTTKEYYNALAKLREKYLKGNKKYHEEEESALEKEWKLRKQLLEEQKDEYEATVKYVEAVIDKRKEALNDEIKELEAKKKALEDANEAKEDELQLQKLEENLAKARQRSIRVYYEGVGWVWTQDKQAIEEAQKELDEYNSKKAIDEIDKQIDAIQDEIDKWGEWLKKWQNIPKEFEDGQNAITAASVLGANAEKDILNQRQKTLDNFKKNYLKTLQDIANAQKGIGAPTVSTSSGSSSSSGSSGGSSGGSTGGGLSVSPTAPSPKKPEMVTFKKDRRSSANQGDVQIKSSHGKNYVYDAKKQLYYPFDKMVDNTGKTTGKATEQGSYYVYTFLKSSGVKYPYQAKASGSPFIGRGGLTNINENGNELIVRNPTRGSYTYLEHGDGVLNAGLTRRIMDFASNPTMAVSDILAKMFNASNTNNTDNSKVINIGTVNLPNVNNTAQFIKELQLMTRNR